jgi:hypothetical protein
MRARAAQYLVGTRTGRLNELAVRTWRELRVKPLPEEEDLYRQVESQARVGKKRSMRRKHFQQY